jgi:NAD(P)H-hydrate epimerase
VNPTGNPGMASAGMGDVLTGLVAGFMAQGVPAYDAARLGAFVHGMAGDRASEARGQHSLLASDVVEAVPQVLMSLAQVRADQAQLRLAGSVRHRKQEARAGS